MRKSLILCKWQMGMRMTISSHVNGLSAEAVQWRPHAMKIKKLQQQRYRGQRQQNRMTDHQKLLRQMSTSLRAVAAVHGDKLVANAEAVNRRSYSEFEQVQTFDKLRREWFKPEQQQKLSNIVANNKSLNGRQWSHSMCNQLHAQHCPIQSNNST